MSLVRIRIRSLGQTSERSFRVNVNHGIVVGWGSGGRVLMGLNSRVSGSANNNWLEG